jgi:hypothetical protein
LFSHLGTNALSVLWDAPYNSENFDLEYFKINILSEQAYIENGTTTEFEYHFNSDIIPPQTSVHIIVTAISKCSQEGHRSRAAEWRDKTVSMNTPDPVNVINIGSTAVPDKKYDMINGKNY